MLTSSLQWCSVLFVGTKLLTYKIYTKVSVTEEYHKHSKNVTRAESSFLKKCQDRKENITDNKRYGCLKT